ncbi:MAG: alpha/beta-type small acid-soluble spore protein [Limnochordales bacterium]
MALGQKRNRALVPQAAQALEQLKNEVSNELHSTSNDPQIKTLQSWYQTGYGGDVPSRVWGSVGGNMVRRMIAAAQQSMIQQATAATQAAFRQALNQPLSSSNVTQTSDPTFSQQAGSTNPFQVQIPPAN